MTPKAKINSRLPEDPVAAFLLAAIPSLDRGQPLADQIVCHLQAMIETQALAPGTRLPPLRHLAAQLGVNRNTVARAYRELAEKGYIICRPGAGSVVRARWRRRQPGAAAADGAPRPPQQVLTEADWLKRLAPPPPRTLTGWGPLRPSPADPIDLLHLRPYTGLFPLEAFRRCLNTVLRRSGRRLLNYGSPAGYLPLREQIARRLQILGIEAHSHQILIFSGSQQGIDLLARALVAENDAIVVETPTYSLALKAFEARGARLLPYAITPQGVDFTPLARLGAGQQVKLFYSVPNLHNPTTHSYTLEEKEELLRHLHRLDSILIEDASDIELRTDADALPPMAAMEPTNRVIYLNSFSKTLVPALRVGYVFVPEPVAPRLAELKELSDLSHSLILQAAIAEFMERGLYDDHLVQVRQFYAERIQRVLEMAAAYLPPGVLRVSPRGGMCLWLDLPDHLDSFQVYHYLRGRGVLVAPGALSLPERPGRDGIRLCVVGESEARVAQGLRLIGTGLERLLRQPPATRRWEYAGMH